MSTGLRAFFVRSFVLLGVIAVLFGILTFFRVKAEAEIRVAHQTLASLENKAAKAALYDEIVAGYGAAVIDEVEQTVPREADLPVFFAWLEGEGQKHGVTVLYNFTGEIAADSQKKAKAGTWFIPVDFVGPADNLAKILTILETGRYHLKIESLTFDVFPADTAQLKVEMTLYGR